jgi:hypothetical protein
MPSFSWAANVSGNWNTGTLWTPISVPNTATGDVMIDATATLAAHTVTPASGEIDTVNSLSVNGTKNFIVRIPGIIISIRDRMECSPSRARRLEHLVIRFRLT